MPVTYLAADSKSFFWAKGLLFSVVFRYMEFFRDVKNIILEGMFFFEGIFSWMS